MRFLKLAKRLRLLKLIKPFLKSDMACTGCPAFVVFMAGVASFNSIITSLELDIPWAAWHYIENMLQFVSPLSWPGG